MLLAVKRLLPVCNTCNMRNNLLGKETISNNCYWTDIGINLSYMGQKDSNWI